MPLYLRRLAALLFAATCLAFATAAEPARTDRSLGPPFKQRVRAVLGSPEARVVMIEVSDFRCEHCRQFHERVFPRIKERYIDRGLVRYVVLPAHAPGFAPAPALFGVAKLALEKGRYWEVRGALYSHGRDDTPAALARLAGLDPVEAAAHVAAPATQAVVAADQAEAEQLKLIGTPTFILRLREKDGNFAEARVDGYESWDYFDQFLTQLLAEP